MSVMFKGKVKVTRKGQIFSWLEKFDFGSQSEAYLGMVRKIVPTKFSKFKLFLQYNNNYVYSHFNEHAQCIYICIYIQQ